jgi:ornithine cyclodeaminase
MRLAGRDAAKVARLAGELKEELAVEVERAASYEAALAGADVVCATTHSPEPIVRRAWLSPGVHVNAVGYNVEGREVDAETVADARVFVESRASALAPPPAGANDLLWPIRDGVITAEHVRGEIGELVTARVPGRTSPDQITLYKSVGVAVQDAAAAALVLEAAATQGGGIQVEL